MIKKAILSAFTLSVFCAPVVGQTFFARVGLGYALPMGGQTVDGSGMPYSGTLTNTASASATSPATETYNLGKASFGAGLQTYLAGGYMFTPNVGIDVAFNLMPAARKYTFNDYNVSINGVAYDITITQKAKAPILLTPALVFKTSGANVKLYTRTGVVVPLVSRIAQHQIFANRPGTGSSRIDDYSWVITNKFSLGFSGAIGVEKRVKAGKLFAEVSFLSLSVFAAKATMVDLTINGDNGYLKYIDPDKRVVNYSTSYTATAGNNYQQPTFSQVYNNCSVNIGYSFPFGSDKSKPQIKYKR